MPDKPYCADEASTFTCLHNNGVVCQLSSSKLCLWFSWWINGDILS